jgi:hypothetical protein
MDIQTKFCKRCNTTKSIDDFYSFKKDHCKQKTTQRYICKVCDKAHQKNRYAISKEYRDRLKNKHAELYKPVLKSLFDINCSICLAFIKSDFYTLKSHLYISKKIKCHNCKETTRKAGRNRYDRKRLKEDPRLRLSKNIRSLIYIRLKKRGKYKKKSRTEDDLGYDMSKLMDRLESMFHDGMNWGNYGQWHIDHIIPDSFFEYNSTKCKGFKNSWSIENLQPLWAKENILKSNKMPNNEK